jgi:oligoribonuclease NrnB/cAMP/cGMP phosphodiesterase (DHH superfamily)
MSNQTTVFFHKDLDGIVSYLVLCWAANKKFNYVATTPMKLIGDWQNWQAQHNAESKLYFLDLDVSKIGEHIDTESTIIFDHHKTNIYPYKNAKTVIYNETSCAKLIYKNLVSATDLKNITDAQKTLIALADDWDSNTKSTPLSENLNIVYHSMSKKVESFIQDYWNGFVPFDKFKQNTIALYKKHREEYLSKLNVYLGTIEFEKEKFNVGAAFCEKYIAECCDYLFEKYKVDVAIAVILEQKRIAVRRNNNITNIDVSKFVQRIASGGGHEAAAGGNLTEEFIEFTKLLKPIN